MPGPAPRDPATLSRRNRATTEQVIDASGDDGSWPNLPPLRLKIQKTEYDPETGLTTTVADTVPGRYRPATRAWYREMQEMPQASALLRPDRVEIARLALLVDEIYSGRTNTPAAHAAVEKSLARFAVTLQDRWRMKLAVERGAKATVGAFSDDEDQLDELAQLRATRPA